AGQVLHTTTADEHDAVLLEVVALTGDVGRHLDARGEANTGHLAERRVRLLRGVRIDTGAHTTALRSALQRRRRLLAALGLTALADQLLDGGHGTTSLRCVGAGRDRAANSRFNLVSRPATPQSGAAGRRGRQTADSPPVIRSMISALGS